MIVEVWFGYLFFIYKYADISQYLAKYSRNGNKNKNKLAKYKSGVLSGDILVKVFVRLTEAASAAESLEPDVPETVCDTIKKLDCKDIPKLSVAARTSLFWVSPPRRHLLVSMTLSGCWQVTPTLEAKSNILLMHNMQDARDS